MHVSGGLTILAAAALLGVACKDNSPNAPGPEVFTATLNGANERPTPVTTAATATAVITVLGDSITWKVDITSAIDSVIAGHIHDGGANDAGGVIQSLSPTATGAGFTGTVAQGSIVPPDSVITLMRAGHAYVNIHTKAHTAGEIRGQLVKQ
jgi:CHRD domain